jgi:hypothetical protein
MRLKTTAATFLSLAHLSLSSPLELEAQNVICLSGVFTQVIVSTIDVHYFVVINQFFEANTIININGGGMLRYCSISSGCC